MMVNYQDSISADNALMPLGSVSVGRSGSNKRQNGFISILFSASLLLVIGLGCFVLILLLSVNGNGFLRRELQDRFIWRLFPMVEYHKR